MSEPPLPGVDLGQLLKDLLIFVTLVFAGGWLGASGLRRRGLMWTWALPVLPVALLLWNVSLVLGLVLACGGMYACMLGARWHRDDLHQGVDRAAVARDRIGVVEVLSRLAHERRAEQRGWIDEQDLEVGRDARNRRVQIPVGHSSGVHTLVLGATGSGKTVTQTWHVCRLIEAGHGAIVIDPKGDRLLGPEAQRIARFADRPFLAWTPEGPLAYNPYAQGTDAEIADKALAGETFTEPHYLRGGQRYIAHAVRTMRAAQVMITPASLMAHMNPRQLEATSRGLPEERAEPVQRYLQELTDRQQRELAGVRDRLSILAESEIGKWLAPADGAPAIDVRDAIDQRAVVYFRLDADRRMLLSEMLAAAIITDLITITGDRSRPPIPTAVVIDEFAAIAADHTGRLFGRARDAGMSMILGTQELADLKAAGEALHDQVLGNLEAMIAHRQNVPTSAELVADFAGTRPVTIATQQTEQRLLGPRLTGQGTITRGYEYEIHPGQIKRLPVGHAAVITPGRPQPPTIARIHHPRLAVR
jgi:hypothetical protein